MNSCCTLPILLVLVAPAGAPERIAEVAGMLPREPAGVGRPITDRQAWQAAAAAPGFKEAVQRAEGLLREPIPDLTDDLYLDFSRTGNRRRCERVISARHNRLGTLVLAECLEDRGRFLPAIEEAVRAICAEKSWVLPAHDRALGNFRGNAVDIDLRSAATSWELATADYWLGDRLSKDARALLRNEIERRTFAPFESCVTTGKPRLHWLTTTNNWNAVCLAGVTGAALALIEPPERRAVFVAAAEKHVKHFLSGFTSDGYCSEGMGYWNYGFGHFVRLAETIGQATGGRIDLLEDPKVRRIAEFGRRMEILPGVYPAFADCHVRSRPDERIQAFVSRRYGLGWQQEEQRGLLLAAGPSSSLAEMGVYGFANAASQRPPAPASAAVGLRDWFEEAGILICRPARGGKRALGVALKGGHNAEHHNHNDVGSFVVALGRGTPLVDPGAEVYTARTFSGERYQSAVLNSLGHPVPRIAGKLQQTGRAAAARIVQTDFTDDADTLVLDLRAAYPVKELQSLRRTFVFSRRGAGKLTITDEVAFSSPQRFGTALVTFAKWRPTRDRALIVGDGADAVKVAIAAKGSDYQLEATVLTEDLPGGLAPTRLGIELAEPVRAAAITVTVVPATDGEGS